ncbi:MAG TPA: glycine--tRNA ligase subunit beta [Polyangiaceae bacterium]|jgi:glycyl-tRNA synthetase beta chain|nr:glycine--tRNA ligase subunit beta [Polyangiaceae bacterium]
MAPPPVPSLPSQALLLEIGVEELPSSYVDAALVALPKIAADELANARLSHGEVRALGTPRRLSVLVHGVATRQLDLDEQVVGPPEGVAFKDGKPTKAAEAFAAKVGVAVDALTIVDQPAGAKQKPGRYVTARRVESGKPAMELLGPALARVCAAIPFRKSMRWGDLDVAFGRPVQWLVALLGEEVVPVTFAGARSGRETRGHRFLAPQVFAVTRPDTYVEQLRERHVLVDREARVRAMVERVEAQARAAGGDYDREPMLVDENASLVEEPHVVTGSFDEAFLALPASVIRAVARGHQKYFCINETGSEDALLPHYLAVVNTANRPDLIAKGSDRVMRARLSDARFFWQEDQKTKLETRYGKLAGIVFHNRLGTVKEKVDRVTFLAVTIAKALELDADSQASAGYASRLAKCDLVTLMVGEFPELQGHVGRAYARAEGLADAVADAIRDHYKPVGGQDDVAPSDVSAAVALADRFDTLAGCFAVGLAPTGAADPFALRRACIGALRTMIDRGYGKLSFRAMIELAYDVYANDGKKLDLGKDETAAKLEEFAIDRLRGLLASSASHAVADAALGNAGPAALRDVVATQVRVRVLKAVVDAREPWLDKARIVAKRLAGISREASPAMHDESVFRGSAKKDDAAIHALVRELDHATGNLATERGVRDALMSMERVATELDRIFLETLVNDPADAFTKPRLETLAHGAQAMARIADFSKLG